MELNTNDDTIESSVGSFYKAQLTAATNFRQSESVWFRSSYLLQFVSNFAGLALSFFALARILMSGFHSHAQAKAMIDNLYGEADEALERNKDKET